MSYQFPTDVNQAIQSLMATGNYSSEEEVLRSALAVLQQHEEDFEAICEGLADLEAGRVRPFSELDAEFRHRHKIDKTS